jgi:hypothetical protein
MIHLRLEKLMLRSIPLVILGLALVSCAQTTRHPSPEKAKWTQRLAGKAAVDGGAGEYQIPIELPDGGPSFRPNVSVSYSSRSGNGPLGVGWNISAAGSIFRCPFIFDGDGLSREVRYAPNDRLCINGDKLVLLKGDYGKSGSVYIQELNAGVLVKLFGDLNSPESGFITFDGAGNTDVYQTPVIHDGVSAPLSWLLTTSINKDGQAIEYSYTSRPYGELWPKEILYGGKYSATDKTLTHGNRFVRFIYDQRNDNSSSFLSGGEQRGTRSLNRVVVGSVTDAGETQEREYVFTYRPSLGTGRSLLVSARACKDVVAKTGCTLPTQFSWQDAKLEFSDPKPIAAVPVGKVIAGRWQPGESARPLTTFYAGGDYNADGRRDLFVRSADNQVSVFVLEPGGKVLKQFDVSKAMSISRNYPPKNGASIRQLGYAEIYGGLDKKFAIMGWTGNSFGSPASTSIAYTGDAVLLDAAGEGMTDVVMGSQEGKKYVVTLYRNRGSSDKEIVLSSGEIVARFNYKPGMHLKTGVGIGNSGRVVLVCLGDKVMHLVGFSTEAGGKVKASTSTLSDIGVSAEAVERGFVFADINGDGLDDIVYTSKSGNWTIQINRDFRFGTPIDTHVLDPRSKVGRAGTLVFDVDSDGRSDIVFPARRLTEFCIEESDKSTKCSDEIATTTPEMDLGIYEYDAVDFRLDATGNYVPHLRSNLNLVGQANRAQPADIFGDGYSYLLSPFDRGVANGWFKAQDGSLVECPPKYACGLHIAQHQHIKRDERSDVPFDFLVAVKTAPEFEARWTYYPISNPFRHLYSVPPVGSPERYLDSRRYYFTSSMYVVGEFSFRDAVGSDEFRYEYGGGEYNTAGRGFDGFKWIILHATGQKKKFGSWFRQDGPYRGMEERSWSEDESDNENDYLHGSPGKKYLSFKRYELRCAGPKDNPVTLRFHCDISKTPSFSAYRKQ